MTTPTLSQNIQDHIIALSINDDVFIKLIRFSVKPEFFSSSITEKIIRICFNYYDQFKKAPNQHFLEELKRQIKKEDKQDQKIYLDYVEDLKKLDRPNHEYIIKQLSDFVKAKEFEDAAIKFVTLIDRNEFEEARSLMFTALRAGVHVQEAGITYLKSQLPSYHKAIFDGKEVLITTGIPALDRLIKGYKRKQFICFLGAAKGKKSWALVHLGKHALLNQLNVLHITHELSAEEVEQRYDMAFGSMTTEERETEISYKNYDQEGKEILEDEEPRIRHTIYNLQRVKKIRKTIKNIIGKMIIKKYPMGICTMDELERYMHYLELYENFVPDVLINDYIDIMSLPMPKESAIRHRINQAYIMHKKIADEKNILVATVSQVNRQAIKSGNITANDAAEDIRKIANADIILALAETEKEAEKELMRLWVIANRSGIQKCGCGISNNLKVGQFALHSWPLRSGDE